MTLKRDDLVHWIASLQKRYAREKQYLTDLDSAIGDADHGINMDRGFSAVMAELEKSAPVQMDSLLKTVAMTLIKTVGGVSGPLYGTFFLRAAAICSQKSELNANDMVAMFESGLDGIVQRGKAQPNDKTMVDAWTPAVHAMKEGLKNGVSIKSILQLGASAAEEGMKNTISMQAKKGRASYLAERSIGHQDPGATSSCWMIQQAADLWE
jgi:dihydroxyacetone kinase-like protein